VVQASIYSVVAGGKVISVGMGCDHAHVPISTINCKEIDLMGSFRYANTVGLAPYWFVLIYSLIVAKCAEEPSCPPEDRLYVLECEGLNVCSFLFL
jgi:hypothetical protein